MKLTYGLALQVLIVDFLLKMCLEYLVSSYTHISHLLNICMLLERSQSNIVNPKILNLADMIKD